MAEILIKYSGYLVWILLSPVAIFYVFNWRNEARLFKPFHLFLIVFTFFIYWIPQGFDTTDEGYMLSKSWSMLHGSWNQNFDLMWGSTFINGLWLSIAGSPDILWARTGYVVLISLIITFSYKTLILYFSKRDSFFITLLTGLVAFSGSPQVISYNNLPVLFIILSLFLFVRALRSGSLVQFFLSGLFISLSVLMRFPNIILLTFPAFYYFLSNEDVESNKIIMRRALFGSYLGVGAGLLLGFFVSLTSGSISDFVVNSISFINDSKNHNHTSDALIRLYKTDLWQIFWRTLFIAPVILVLSILTDSNIRKIYRIFMVVFASYFAFFTLEFYSDSQNWKFFIISFGFTSLMIFLILKKSANTFNIIFISIILFFFSFIGSNNGIRTLFWSGALILPFGSFVLLLKGTGYSFQGRTYGFSLPVISFMLFMVIQLISLKDDDVYRERPRKELTSKFNNAEMSGIRSNLQRVNATDSLIHFMKETIKKDETLFIIGPAPIFYYLLDVNPLISGIWTCSPAEFEKKNLNYSSIDYFLLPKKDPRENSWPRSGIFPSLSSDISMTGYYLKYLEDNLYVKLYENSVFILFAHPGRYYDLNKAVLIHDNNCSEFENGILTGWNRHRLNSEFTISADIYQSHHSSQRIKYDNRDDETGITKEILDIGAIYFIEAWLLSEKEFEIIIQAGGGNSIRRMSMPSNQWTKVEAYLLATGKTLYLYSGNGLNTGSSFYIDDIKVMKLK